MRLVDVAQFETRLDEMITGVEVTVVLQRRAVAAGRGVDTQQVAAKERLEGDVKELDENRTDVMTHPFFEDIHEEAAVLLAANRTLRHQASGLGVEEALLTGPLAPALVGDCERLCGSALDDRNKLHPVCTQLVAEEAINRAAVVLVSGIDRAQDVVFDPMFTNSPPSFHH